MNETTKSLQRQLIRKAVLSARQAKFERAQAAGLCDVFAETLAHLDRIDSVDVLLSVDHEAEPDNVFSTPIVRKVG